MSRWAASLGEHSAKGERRRLPRLFPPQDAFIAFFIAKAAVERGQRYLASDTCGFPCGGHGPP